jgi:hypothetical protein
LGFLGTRVDHTHLYPQAPLKKLKCPKKEIPHNSFGGERTAGQQRMNIFLILLLFNQICKICFSYLVPGLSEEMLISSIQAAEKDLKIYIYDIPRHLQREHNPLETLYHFSAEFLLIKYFRSLRNVPADDSRSGMIVDDPEKANLFFINHCLETCRLQPDEKSPYMKGIIDNVLFNYPFYNRSGGRDHYFFGLYDHGI